jgi:hypothetical protein
VTRPVGRTGENAIRIGLITIAAVFAVLVLFPLLVALAGAPYR